MSLCYFPLWLLWLIVILSDWHALFTHNFSYYARLIVETVLLEFSQKSFIRISFMRLIVESVVHWDWLNISVATPQVLPVAYKVWSVIAPLISIYVLRNLYYFNSKGEFHIRMLMLVG